MIAYDIGIIGGGNLGRSIAMGLLFSEKIKASNITVTRRKVHLIEDLKAKGIIRAHGVSVHSLDAMKDALNSPWVDVIHVRINPYGIAMDKPDPEEVVKVIHKLHDSGKGIIGMKLIGDGKYSNDSVKIDNALRFVLGLESVDMMIIGLENIEQIDNYVARVKKQLSQISHG